MVEEYSSIRGKIFDKYSNTQGTQSKEVEKYLSNEGKMFEKYSSTQGTHGTQPQVYSYSYSKFTLLQQPMDHFKPLASRYFHVYFYLASPSARLKSEP